MRTQSAQTATTIVSPFPNEIFFGFAAEKPIAINIITQKEKTSNEVNSAIIHRGESLEIYAPGFEPTRCSRSIVSGDFRNNKINDRSPWIASGIQEKDTMASATLKLSRVPASKLNAPSITAATIT